MSSINDVIKARKFDSNGHKAFVNLLFTYYHFNSKQTDALKPYDILPQHYNILRIIKGKYPEPVTPGHILSVMLDKKRDLTRLIDKLTTMGYLVKNQSEDNRRNMLIQFTEKGLKFYAVVDQLMSDKIVHNLTENESEQLSNLLDKMRDE
jgi:DNA-binding MarR family transcriptional regulator